MRISLDYDDTYTLDPEFWNWFIGDVRDRGHEIMVVTYRDDEWPIEHDLHAAIPVYYTGGYAKRAFMADLGIGIDVWIDDWPEGILIGQGFKKL